MARRNHNEVTSKRVGKIASKVLRKSRSKAAKSAAASALTQPPNRRKRR